ncbi:ATPase, AAA-type, core [Artemisia annua]|uniref:ATPase, AAA-type, core n=1 Tax=Artemisia annua TaxID=35608 RepID=A0A2U1P3C3_ARTAN|nr:ATPase, AAA-type, core [Artemisia annua]
MLSWYSRQHKGNRKRSRSLRICPKKLPEVGESIGKTVKSLQHGVEAASSSTSGGDPIAVKDREQEEVRSVDDPLKDSLKEDDKVTVGGHVESQDGQPLVSPMTLGESLMDLEKSKAANGGGSSVLNRNKKRQAKTNVGVGAWGKLLSQCSQNPHVVMDRSIFTVGQGRQCDLSLGDPSISKSLCSLRHIESQQGGSSITLLEITGGKGSVKVNGKTCQKRSTLPLRAGDEIFQQLSNDNVAADVAPSVSILEAHSGSLKGLQFESRSRDPSAVTGASILASLSNIQKELSLLPPPSRKGKGIQTGMPNLPSTSEVPDSSVTDTEMKDASDPNDGEKGVAPDENVDGASVDAEMGNTPAATHELRPLLRMLAGSSASEFDILKILDERKESQKDNDPPISLAARRQAYKDSLQQGIVDPDTIEVTFNDFPYYLSETTKNVLITSTYIHLKHNEFVKYASDLPTLCPRILLSGPAGSEIYQETLTKALAKHFGARLLVVESLLLPGGSAAKEVDTTIKESTRPERASVFAKRAPQSGVLHSRKPASSVEADIVGGSSTCSHAHQPKQEASTATSKTYTFKKGIFTFNLYTKFLIFGPISDNEFSLCSLEEATGLAFRFIIGKTADASKMAELKKEAEEYDDFVMLDIVEEYSKLPYKTLAFFKAAYALYDSEFYVKADDDIYLRPDRLSLLLAKERSHSQTYLGCMKKGPVFTDPNLKWYEPLGYMLGKEYFLHAYGPIYALSADVVASLVALRNDRQVTSQLGIIVTMFRPLSFLKRFEIYPVILFRMFSNEDVTIGAWMLAMNVNHEDDRQLCQPECTAKSVAVWDIPKCSGLCHPEKKMLELHKLESCANSPTLPSDEED